MADYSEDHASAVEAIREAGAPAVFVSVTGGTYDPVTDQLSGETESRVPGDAVEVRGDPERYAALGLTPQSSVTLKFAPTVYGGTPTPGSSVTWGGALYTVRACEPLAPDGRTILATVVCAR